MTDPKDFTADDARALVEATALRGLSEIEETIKQNARRGGHHCQVPANHLNEKILKALKDRGFILTLQGNDYIINWKK